MSRYFNISLKSNIYASDDSFIVFQNIIGLHRIEILSWPSKTRKIYAI